MASSLAPAAALLGGRWRRRRRRGAISAVGSRLRRIDGQDSKMREREAAAEFGWERGGYGAWRRTAHVWTFFLSLNLRLRLDAADWTYHGGFSEEKQRARWRRTATWMRERVLDLGPTFIKLGQMFSTRSDLLPAEFVDELVKLQDQVPSFSAERARQLIEAELGAPVDDLFEEFHDRPIAAASLGQVHLASLHNGEKVVIKVQRPGLKKLFDIDLKNLKILAQYFQSSETFGGPKRDWLAIYNECSKVLYEEIDYINEGKNADRFRRDFRNVKWVRVPFVQWDHTSRKILTLEYVPGIKVTDLREIDARGYPRSKIASRAIESYLIQILKTGFFHADPHPGNLSIDGDGSIVFYDFGMMGDIKSFTQERLLELFFAVYEKDTKKVMNSLVDMEVLQPTGDMTSVQRAVQFFMDNSMNRRPGRMQTVAAIGEDLFAIASDNPISFPSTFTFVMKAFTTIEGIGYTLDPEFSFARVAAPYVQELIDARQKQQNGVEMVQEIQRQTNDARNHTLSMPYRIQQIEEIMRKLESGDLKLRVRVLESERAAKRASIMQMATIYTVLGSTLLHIGVTMITQDGSDIAATGFFISGGVMMVLSIRSMQKVQELDKIEKMF
ncbi:protein ACTIVITY OF BC1 COMPLEX KINASE 7, chloroplastic-like [Wolffia australiana]